jgi:hypothetical protein
LSRSMTTATSSRCHPTSCPRSTSTASDHCRTRGHDKAPSSSDSTAIPVHADPRRRSGMARVAGRIVEREALGAEDELLVAE